MSIKLPVDIGFLPPVGGVALALFAADPAYDFEVQRAPDSAGAPNVGAAATLPQNAKGTDRIYIDPLPLDGTLRWYRARHIGNGDTPSSYTDWISATPVAIPTKITPPAPPTTVISRSPGNRTTVDGIIGNLTDVGHAAAAMQESGGKAINRLLAKTLAGDSNSLDGTPDGTTYLRMRRVQSAYGPVQLLFQANNLQLGSTVEGAVASFSLPGGTLSTNGDMLRITVAGRWASVGDTFRVVFGATQLWSAPGAAAAAMFRCEIILIRTGATTQRYVTLSISGSAPSTTQSTGTPGETLSGAVTIDFKSKDNNAGTPLTVDAIIVEFLGA
jgi:hypothetical protein